MNNVIFLSIPTAEEHVREHLDYAMAPNDSALDFGNVSLAAPNDSLCDDPPRSPCTAGRKLAPNPSYRLPSAPSSPCSSDHDTLKTVPATPISQLPTTQMSTPNDIPSQGSPQLRSPTSSPASWPEVREMSPSIPNQSTPNMFPSGVSPIISHSSSVGTPPSVDSSPSSAVANNPTPPPLPLQDLLHLATPFSSFSTSYPENDNDKDLIPSRQLKEPRISDFGYDESAQPSRLFDTPTPELLRMSPHSRSVTPPPQPAPTTPISLSPNESPSVIRELLGDPSPPPELGEVVSPPRDISAPVGLNGDTCKVVINPLKSALLPYNDLRHRIGKSRRCDGVKAARSTSVASSIDIACSRVADSHVQTVVSTVAVAISSCDDDTDDNSVNVEPIIVRDEEDLERKRYADNAATALRILKSVFRGEEQCDSQPPIQPQVLRGPATTASSAVNVDDSPDLFDESSSNVPRPSPKVAPPVPVVERLHPMRNIHDPISHRRTPPVNICENIRRVRFLPT